MLRFEVAATHAGKGRWRPEQRPYEPLLQTLLAVTNRLTAAMLSAEFGDGFGPACDGEHSFSLLAGFRVTNSANCTLTFHALRDGLHRIFLRLRVYDNGVRLQLQSQTR